MYGFGRGVRIFENIAGVRIRTLVYEKKNSDQKGCRSRGFAKLYTVIFISKSGTVLLIIFMKIISLIKTVLVIIFLKIRRES